MRMKRLDKCIKNKMENDIRKEQKKIQEDVTKCKTAIADNKQNIADNERNISYNKQEIHNIRNIPRNIKRKLINCYIFFHRLFYRYNIALTRMSVPFNITVHDKSRKEDLQRCIFNSL